MLTSEAERPIAHPYPTILDLSFGEGAPAAGAQVVRMPPNITHADANVASPRRTTDKHQFADGSRGPTPRLEATSEYRRTRQGRPSANQPRASENGGIQDMYPGRRGQAMPDMPQPVPGGDDDQYWSRAEGIHRRERFHRAAPTEQDSSAEDTSGSDDA